jgi:hypothetical protein
MTKNEKCIGCEFHIIKGTLVSEPILVLGAEPNLQVTNQKLDKVKKSYDFCTFRGINLVNIIVKDCSVKDRLNENYKELAEERNKLAFKSLPQKIDFFR